MFWANTHNLRFEQKREKYQNFLSEFFSIFGGKIFNIFERRIFVMEPYVQFLHADNEDWSDCADEQVD